MISKRDKPHIHVSAGLIRYNKKLLIAKRPKGSHLEGFWEFPGGKKEDNESPESCLVREIKEELGIGIRDVEPFMCVCHEYETKVIFLHVFHCVLATGQPRSLEGQTVCWVRTEDLIHYQFPPPDEQIIWRLTQSGVKDKAVDPMCGESSLDG